MKKNDKLIVLAGVAILVIASIGVYYWSPEGLTGAAVDVKTLFSVSGSFSDVPTAITVSDSSPFYALIATPLAVHYDKDGNQEVVPLYVENVSSPSRAIVRTRELVGRPVNLIVDGSETPEEASLELAASYWEKSDAVLLIEDSQEGYNLGLVAAPIASYLSIPIIVTDGFDAEVYSVLKDLGVKYSLVCGDFSAYGASLRFTTVDEIMNFTIDLIEDKFGEVKYITLANPLDAWPPQVLDKKIVLYERGELKSGNMFPSHFIDLVKSQFLGKKPTFSFKIPEDYKYALVKLDVKNLEDPRYVEEFGDNLILGGSLTGYLRTSAYPGERDANGNLKHDMLHFETVMYDQGGEEYTITLSSNYHILDSAEFELTVTVEELSDPYYPMMKQLSSIAPYLTAYHKGIIFAKPEFAFAPTDDVKINGKTLPGNTQVFYNPMLIPVINKHVYEKIHLPLNNLLATLRDIDISESVEYLRQECYQNPFYIALVGDAIMLPQYYYRSPHSDPFSKPSSGGYGTNTPSDFIYGNIDPELYSLAPYPEDYLENDIYTYYPVVENIVGRITGWNIQDASALIARTIFYDNVIESMGDWKNNAAVLTGAGAEVQKLPILTTILETVFGDTEPTKFPSGEKRFLVKRIKNTFEKGGFKAFSAERGRAQREGYSIEALREIKKDGILNRIFFPFGLAKRRQGFDNVESLFNLSWWIQDLHDSSDLVIGGKLEQNSNLIISDSHAIWFEKEHGDVLMHSIGGPRLIYQLICRYLPLGGRTPLDSKGSYSVREVSQMEMGPSVMLVEGCGSGKIDGFLPINSLANAYLHAGVNAYISPTTLSAFYGALEPRPDFHGGVGLGIRGYLNASRNAKKGVYPPVYFNQFIFEKLCLEMFEQDVTIGTALRDAKNAFLPAQFNITFRWTPPLSIPSSLPQELREDIQERIEATAGKDMRFPVEKYCTIYQINLLGDPAFNPYEPCNEGK